MTLLRLLARTRIAPVLLALGLALSAPARAEDSAARASAKATAAAFQQALQSGDAAAVRRLLAPDAVVLEGGHQESLEEYLSHHLAADIEFAKAVPSRLVAMEAQVDGATAWVWSTRTSEGQFRKQALKLVNAELMVLTRLGEGWQIRAIHWSSRKGK